MNQHDFLEALTEKLDSFIHNRDRYVKKFGEAKYFVVIRRILSDHMETLEPLIRAAVSEKRLRGQTRSERRETRIEKTDANLETIRQETFRFFDGMVPPNVIHVKFADIAREAANKAVCDHLDVIIHENGGVATRKMAEYWIDWKCDSFKTVTKN